MTFTKAAAVAAFVAAAALTSGMTAAGAHGKKLHLHGIHGHNQPFHTHGHGLTILSTSVSPCAKWWHRYLRTGNKTYLYSYQICMR